MRHCRILILASGVWLVATASMSQTLASKNGGLQPLAPPAQGMVSLKEALADLGKAYQVDFLYEEAVVQGRVGLNLASVSQNFETDLNQVLGDNPLAYAKVGARTIVITPREPVAAPSPPANGSIKGKVTDEKGQGLPFAQAILEGTTMGAAANANGEYDIENVPPGTYRLQIRMIGYHPVTAEVTVADGMAATHDFTLVEDLLMLGETVVTGVRTPRTKLESTVAISTLSPRAMEQAAPRSTTEVLRYVPGFTRVESSGGEVNQNVSFRGILGVEYVMFMEDGLPVFPTMHTFFMNADNLFRPDENIATVEVVRGGNSALFGSNTPGAIVNFINKTGGPELGGVVKASAATGGLARYDFNLNGPLGDKWRFNVGGFYRYDHGVRDPGFPGIRGGQLKGNITRLLDNGYVRASLKLIDDRNQFILPLPFKNPDSPEYVQGFGDFGSMSTNEGNHILVPIPTGNLELPLDDGLRTKAYWLTADASFDFGGGWTVQNTAQVMQNDQGWNAIVPFNVQTAGDFFNGRGFPAGSTYQLFFTNHKDNDGNTIRFNTANGLVAPSGEWHVEKPLSAFQNQMQFLKTVGKHKFSAGIYFANYTQNNTWYFTEILTDVRDNPRFLDLVVQTPTGTVNYTKNGFNKFLTLYRNGAGSTTIFSGVLGGELQLSDRLRADLGVRYESNDFVQSAENLSNVDLDGDPATPYDNEQFGNGSFRHLNRILDDWAGSLGLNYSLNERLSLYAQGSRAYKMPALDEFLDAQAQGQVDKFKDRKTTMIEAGVKSSSSRLGFTVNGFWGELTNIVGQGLEVVNGQSQWVTRTSPDNRSYGAELEVSASPTRGLTLLGAGTILKTQTIEAAGAALTAGGVPKSVLNVSGTYATSGLTFLADWHFVGSRDLVDAPYNSTTGKYEHYTVVGELKAYSYFNLGASYKVPRQAITLAANVLNVGQSKGLEEGNPRLAGSGGAPLFLARPILPRRLSISMTYNF